MLIEENEVSEALQNLNGMSQSEIKRNNDLDILERLTHRKRAGAFWSKFGFNELCQVKELFEEAYKEAEEAQILLKQEQQKKDDIRSQLEKLLEENGYSSSDIFGSDEIERPIRTKRTHGNAGRLRGKQKLWYKVNIFGKDFYWSGQGATPSVFHCAYTRYGTKKSDYRLDKPLDNTPELRDKKIPVEYMVEAQQLLAQGGRL